MLKRTITYTNIDDQQVTEDFYFNLSKAELAEMELSKPGGFEAWVKSLMQTNDGGVIIAAFKDLVAMTVGERTQDGKFIKSENFKRAFMSSEPYSIIFMEFLENPNSVGEFLKATLPQDLVQKLREEQTAQKREYTEKELLEMDDAQFQAIAGPNPRDWSREHLQIGFQRKSRHNQPQAV